MRRGRSWSLVKRKGTRVTGRCSIFRIYAIVAETVRSFDQHNGSSYAAAIAYHAVISLAPLVLFATLIAALFTNLSYALDQLAQVLTRAGGETIAEFGVSLVTEFQRPTTTNFVAALGSFLIVIYSASNVFRQLVIAQDAFWGVSRPKPLVADGLGLYIFKMGRRYIVGLIAALAIIFSLLMSIILGFLVDLLIVIVDFFLPGSGTLAPVVGYWAVPVILVLLCWIGFRTLPSVDLTWWSVFPGALLTGIAMSVAGGLIIYVANTNPIPYFYGVFGSVVIVMLWVYFSALIFLFGAEFTRVYLTYGKAADNEIM